MAQTHTGYIQNKTEGDEVEDEDYMNMVIAEPAKERTKETYTQRRLRKEREARERGRAKTKEESATEVKLAREQALSKSLLADTTTLTKNKGLAMMTKMGFKNGAGLGRANNSEARLEPVRIQIKEDRGGIGMDTERKRRMCEDMDREVKKSKADESGYRERIHNERQLARLELLVEKAMRIAEQMNEKLEEVTAVNLSEMPDYTPFSCSSNINNDKYNNNNSNNQATSRIPPSKTNVLWRGLTRKREEKERERRRRHELHQSLSRLSPPHRLLLPNYEDPYEDSDYKMAMGNDVILLEENIEEEDDELDEFTALDPLKRLQMLVFHLRKVHNYCFWCKYTYSDEKMDGCPGLTEEDHD